MKATGKIRKHDLDLEVIYLIRIYHQSRSRMQQALPFHGCCQNLIRVDLYLRQKIIIKVMENEGNE